MNNLRREHPRPQFIRKNWTLLDGTWAFQFDDENQGIKQQWYQGVPNTVPITVPFTYETELSGINDPSHHSVVWYEKKIVLEEQKKYTLLFEGVDYFSQIWLNGKQIGTHQGAYERFEFDLTEALPGENHLVIRVEDSLAEDQPRGKQRWLTDNFGCWYVQTTGIWKSVWLEEQQSDIRLASVKMTPDLINDQIIFEPLVKEGATYPKQSYLFEADVSFAGQSVSSYRGLLTHSLNPISLQTKLKEDGCWGTKVWSPESPHLYDVTFRLFTESGELLDEVSSYFGMRDISIKKGQVLLNHHQLYQRLILDQGYWKESGITPPSLEALEVDLDWIIEMGYNGLRKHQKIEDERFLYLCDEKGLLVWSEMASTYLFNDQAMERFVDEWQAIIRQNYNHPSIITWVPFNESWGIKGIEHDQRQQHFTESIYYLTKSFDKQRPVITNDGWVHTISDILTLHDYEEYGERFKMRYENKKDFVTNEYQFNQDFYAFADGYHYQDQPIIISEFGGIAFTTEKAEDWGYGHQVRDEEQFLTRFDAIHQAIQDLPFITGYCYTQLTDVEQEVNGLLTTDRKPKVDLAKVKEINMRRVK
ncbi:sugar-binding domain-containing protein [Enterococcus sp. DIV0660C]|uniref:glycoside hydrolase family 2 protein n=1 Tax=Enterococcus sp. DIV0660C TaxID=2230880 RepID=UPI001A905529|nr:sugar-binding domain-containing protein [Enterococcus sp. DIV0660C]MBO0431202.1 glycoside hydrolase family 2 [Enterococcus sp. DIV0660C]